MYAGVIHLSKIKRESDSMKVALLWIAVPVSFLTGGLLASAVVEVGWNLGWFIIPTCDEPGLLGILDVFGLCPQELFLAIKEVVQTIVWTSATLIVPVFIAPSHKRDVAVACGSIEGILILGIIIVLVFFSPIQLPYIHILMMIAAYAITFWMVISRQNLVEPTD